MVKVTLGAKALLLALVVQILIGFIKWWPFNQISKVRLPDFRSHSKYGPLANQLFMTIINLDDAF